MAPRAITAVGATIGISDHLRPFLGFRVCFRALYPCCFLLSFLKGGGEGVESLGLGLMDFGVEPGLGFGLGGLGPIWGLENRLSLGFRF